MPYPKGTYDGVKCPPPHPNFTTFANRHVTYAIWWQMTIQIVPLALKYIKGKINYSILVYLW